MSTQIATLFKFLNKYNFIQICTNTIINQPNGIIRDKYNFIQIWTNKIYLLNYVVKLFFIKIYTALSY